MQLLIDYMCDEDDRLDEIVPEGRNFIPVTVAADGSAAEFDVFVDDSSPEPKGDPVGRILVRRESGPAIAS